MSRRDAIAFPALTILLLTCMLGTVTAASITATYNPVWQNLIVTVSNRDFATVTDTDW